MATIHPFMALRPTADRVRDVACVPYDVITTAEARALAQGNPHSFLRVVRPEIELAESVDEHDDAVYHTGAQNLRAFAESDFMMTEDAPSLYVYRLVMNGRAQTGLFGCVSVSDYDDGLILKHENTRQDKEDDRTRHILEQQAHAEPVMLTYRDQESVSRLVELATREHALYDFEAADGVRHTVWRMPDPRPVVSAFEAVPALYVADGHHRCKAASRAAAELAATGDLVRHPEAAFFPAVLFPMSQMQILPYNRIVRKLPAGLDAFLDQLQQRVSVHPDGTEKAPASPGHVSVYAGGQWYAAKLPPTKKGTVADQLDVARLAEHVLEPILGIQDPRTDQNIDFVGGIRGTDELERLVDAGAAELAFSMYPTSIEELVDVSAAGQLMPPKSTWFEPKLRSGLLVHQF